ncbi:D-3-phosphoglycerate dehydrogenase [Halobacillus dabanensis]|uniref:D-3-phosphoglycerate dehydrogenase n=1 Tax=Halobacillus dabanensis TaxID=240302 RepID=A0A1I3S419_HALDA|nr:C-terminal binding protein [Halobacillus dabanensis]SFJ52246.1 D-3-phosphoglycerate dehydrogenase [Halobacillus dabanensis]
MKVVITDHEYEDLRYEESELKHQDIELVKMQCKTEDEVIESCHDADGIINLYAPISRRVIESLTKCKVITRYGVGVDTIDLEAATEKGILIGNVPDYGVDEVSDHALALIMSLLRKITTSNQQVKNGAWDVNHSKPIRRLNTLTIGLVGFGNIPRRLAEKIQVLGINVIVSDPFLSEEIAEERNVTLVSLEELCKISDLISVHAPLNDTTRGMIGKEQFGLMKKGVYLVNTARGPVIEEDALLEALENGVVAGGGLDVIDSEPIAPNHPFLTMENIILTPHMAGYSEESAAEMRTKTALGITDVLVHKQYPKYLVNKNVKEKVKLKPFVMDGRYAF